MKQPRPAKARHTPRKTPGPVMGVAAMLARADTACVFATALLLRLLYLFSIRHAYFLNHPQTEALHYHEWATLVLDAPVPPSPPFEQAPGYPYFVAAIYALFGRNLMAVALVQAALDAASCSLIAAAGVRWFGRRTGVLAGVLAAMYGPLIYFTGELLPATLLVFTTMSALTAALASAWILAGCLWGVALVVRSEIVLALPLVVFDAWRRARGRGAWYTAAPVVLVFAAFLAANAAHSPKLVLLTTSGGVNLWLGNNLHADGVSPFISGPLEPVATAVRAHAADSVDADILFRGYALAFWKEHPRQALWLLWKKFLWTWTDRELPNTSDIEWQTAQSWLFQRPFFPLSFGVILPFAAAGALLLGGEWRELTLLAGLLAIGIGSSLTFFTNARFRLPMAPAMLLLAAFGLDRTIDLARTWRENRRALLVAILAIALGMGTAWGDFYGIRTYRIPQITVNTGILERESGQLEMAVQHLRQGLADDPHDTIAWIHLALALEQLGRRRAALQAYFDALAWTPGDDSLQQMTRRFLVRQGLNASLLQDYLYAPDDSSRAAVTQSALDALGKQERSE